MSKTFQKITVNPRNERGFTLLEVIMAVSILTVGLLAVASMQISAMRGNSMSMTYTESTEMVQDRVEKLLPRNLTELTDRTNDGLDGRNNATVDLADGNEISDPKYKVYWNVIEDWAGGTVAEGGRAVNGVNTIRVIVSWQGGKRYFFDILKNRI